MKNFITAAILTTLSISSSFAISDKRGVGENAFTLGCQIDALRPGVTWFYNWGNTGPKGYQNQIEESDFEFVPMCWNGNFDADKIREYVRNHPQTKYLLGFNEPNFKNQANLTPKAAAERWPEVKALADELGLKLVAPALNYSPDAPYTQPTSWMDEFVALVGPDAFDYTAIHNYGGLGVMKTLSTQFYERYGKPVWVTEFCFWPGGAGAVTVSPITQIASMIESVEWLEQTDFIHRYAWFKPIGQHSADSGSPNYGLLQTQTNFDETLLSEQGNVYVYMSDFNPDRYHQIGDRFSATDYVTRKLAMIGNGNNSEAPVPIEVTEFKSGAHLDYNFEVAAGGDYNLLLTVSGVGEPISFDPKLALYQIDSDGNQGTTLMDPQTFTLTGDNMIYKTISLPVYLTAGRQTIRLADANPYAPSGIRISTIELVTRGAGVENLSPEYATGSVMVYSIDGIPVKVDANPANPLQDLPAGIYIVNGKKLRK